MTDHTNSFDPNAFATATEMDTRALERLGALVSMALECGLTFAQFRAMADALGGDKLLPATASAFEPEPPVDTAVPPGSGRLGKATVEPSPDPFWKGWQPPGGWAVQSGGGRTVFDLVCRELRLSDRDWVLMAHIACLLSLMPKLADVLTTVFSDPDDAKKAAELTPDEVAKLRGFLGLTDPAAASPSQH